MPTAPRGLFAGRFPRAFTLVEVALSLGIVAFALTAVVSLLSVSLDADRAARDDTLLAEIARSTVSELRSVPFADALKRVQEQPTLYFDAEGAAVANAAQAAYECHRTATEDAERTGTQGPNLLRVRLEFRWPPGAGSAGAEAGNRRVVHVNLARYE